MEKRGRVRGVRGMRGRVRGMRGASALDFDPRYVKH